MLEDRDALTRYIADISHYPRINPERERDLSRTIHGGGKKHEVENAVNELVVSNLRLVIHCAKDFFHSTSHPDTSLDVMDLIAEGNVALMSAARSYDAEFGGSNGKTGAVKFSSFACKCIKRRLMRALRHSRFIRIPEHHFTCRKRIAEMEEAIDGPLGEEMITEELGITVNKLHMIREGQDSYTCRLEDLQSEDGTSHWMDFLENANAVRPDAEASRRDLRKFMVEEILRLPPRASKIILKVFLAPRPFTFRELSDEFHVTKERCRQICVQGLNLLRRRIEPRLGKSVGIGLAFKSEQPSLEKGPARKLVLIVSSNDRKERPRASRTGKRAMTSRIGERHSTQVDILWPQFDGDMASADKDEDGVALDAAVA